MRVRGATACARHSRRTGFTLVELIVVITIIGILAVLIAPRVTGFIDDSRYTSAKSSVSQLYKQCELYRAKTGEWPDTLEQLTVDDRERNWKATLQRADLIDPWNTPYLYELYDDGPVVRCTGADRQPGGTDEYDVDLTYPALAE